MKVTFIFLFLVVVSIGCNTDENKEQTVIEKKFECSRGLMQPAWYESGMDENYPKLNQLQNGFIIIVDTLNRASDFVSIEEEYLRYNSVNYDTIDLDWIEGWDKLSVKEKLELANQKRKSFLIHADSVHNANNQEQQQVWVVNNTSDTVGIQMQDGSFICVLQAKTKNGQWYPIQYWRFSTCGNSYFLKLIPPKIANSFITTLPNNGDYKTKLRYKLLGENKFYYSNVFEGKINYCEFVEDSSSFSELYVEPRPHYKLDSLMELTRRFF